MENNFILKVNLLKNTFKNQLKYIKRSILIGYIKMILLILLMNQYAIIISLLKNKMVLLMLSSDNTTQKINQQDS